MTASSITLVSAFFPIHRERWSQSGRSSDRYFEYFRHWARIPNDLIVFCLDRDAKRVKEIRDSFGRDNTTIITVDSPDSLLPDIHHDMTVASHSYSFFSLRPAAPEAIYPEYDYVMALKFWCLSNSTNIAKTPYLAWIDFGFDHGGTFYKNPSQFDTAWDYQFTQDVTLFAVKKDDHSPIFDIIRRTDTIVQGDCFVVRTDYVSSFAQNALNNYRHLLACGLLDDDQIVLLMCARQQPDHVRLLPSTWFSQFNDYSSPTMSRVTKPVYSNNTPGKRARLHWARLCWNYCARQFTYLRRRITLA